MTYTINIVSYSFVYDNIIFISDGIRLLSCDICGEQFIERIVMMMHKDINHSQHRVGWIHQRRRYQGRDKRRGEY
jgi:hypothetical protein